MIPVTDDLVNDVTISPEKTRTFGLADFDVSATTYPENSYQTKVKTDGTTSNRQVMIDDKDSLLQHISHLLQVERGKYYIFSDNYGIETIDLIGKPKSYSMAVLQNRIEETLKQDSRVISVDNFEFTFERSNVTVKFVVNSIYGSLNQSLEVIL